MMNMDLIAHRTKTRPKWSSKVIWVLCKALQIFTGCMFFGRSSVGCLLETVVYLGSNDNSDRSLQA
ncbi:hypothetical protein BDV26DRAFT_265683 [Aspergillus bertholletiae]|uniref:Uncharacterized protein n=1 Tax=Aspergillus bertholletiae TaxID=1226010 RepID=A0A5N7B306_9EURO|nr:hypothetical protein BDV26DRAFT_265683 [Aspergillus bertholletiae]